MDKKLVDAINEQIKNEFASAYLYLSMAAYSESINLDGFSAWMKKQAQEEVGHAMKLFGFLSERGEKVVLKAIPQPQTDFESPLSIFKETLKHEKKVTKMINDLYNLAKKVGDNATEIFLQWFVSEQVEEEASASSIVEKLKMVKPESGALLMLDKALEQRAAH